LSVLAFLVVRSLGVLGSGLALAGSMTGSSVLFWIGVVVLAFDVIMDGLSGMPVPIAELMTGVTFHFFGVAWTPAILYGFLIWGALGLGGAILAAATGKVPT
jgi:hypothetical protein